jgi:hypothetical protein
MADGARAHITKDTLSEVLDAARDPQGRVCCDHCHDPIRDDQMLTIQHIVPRRLLKGETFDELAAALDIAPEDIPQEDAYGFFRAKLNAPDNLRPMHNACHRFVDFGIELSPAEAEIANRKDPVKDREFEELQALSTPMITLEGAKLAGKVLLSHRNEIATILRREKDTDVLKECREQLALEMMFFADLEESHERPRLKVQHVKHEGSGHAQAIADKMEVLDSIIAKREASASVA